MTPTGKSRKVTVGEEGMAFRDGDFINKVSATYYEYQCHCGKLFESRLNQNKTNCGCVKRPSKVAPKKALPRFVRPERPDSVCKSCTPKLTQAIADEIRTLWSEGAHSRYQLGDRFCVSQTTVHNVLTGKVWNALRKEDSSETGNESREGSLCP